MSIVKAAHPWYIMIPTLAEVTGKSKFPTALLSMNKLSPSETKVIDYHKKKEADRERMLAAKREPHKGRTIG